MTERRKLLLPSFFTWTTVRRIVSLCIESIAWAAAWLFAAELREGTFLPSSDSVRTNCTDPCRSTCQSKAVHQSTRLHRAPGEDFRALFPVQSASLDFSDCNYDQAIAASMRASAAFAVAFTASRFPRIPVVEYAPSISTNWTT